MTVTGSMTDPQGTAARGTPESRGTAQPRWAELRQVVLATLDHPADTARARRLLGLGPGFADPVLADWGLIDDTMPVGPDTYLELVSPTSPDHPLARWLAKVGGSAGYVLSTQVPTLDGVRDCCAELGIGIVADTETDGHPILQLHPKQMGVMLELDAFVPRSGWFWDELPDAEVAHAHTDTDIVDIRAIEIAAPDPAGLAATWAKVLGLEAVALAGGAWAVPFGDRPIRFVPATGRPGLAAVEVAAADRERGPGRRETVCGTEFRFV
jgi:hypothetical protein